MSSLFPFERGLRSTGTLIVAVFLLWAYQIWSVVASFMRLHQGHSRGRLLNDPEIALIERLRNAGNDCRNIVWTALLVCQIDQPLHAFLRLKLLNNLSYLRIADGF